MKTKPSLLDYAYHHNTKIPVNLLVGLKWKDDEGRDFVTELLPSHYRNGKRIARFSTSSYVGTCAIGAMHYYGRIDISTPSCKQTHKDGTTSGGHGGYMGKQAPEIEPISIQVQRRLTRVERDMDGDVIGGVGDWTYRFNRESDVLPAAIKTFKRKFEPGWVLLGYDDNGEEKVLCET